MKNRLRMLTLLTACFVVAAVVATNATTVKKMNITDLITYGDQIVVGQVVSMYDGFDANGLPYTEVTVNISETIHGTASGSYTFRQFGLMEPRIVTRTKTSLMVSPDGWPKFKVGEEVLLFLYESTSLGFQSTVGLLQGKFSVHNGQVVNEIDNAGLFLNTATDPNLLSVDEKKMLQVKKGPVSKKALTSFVNKAITHGWSN